MRTYPRGTVVRYFLQDFLLPHRGKQPKRLYVVFFQRYNILILGEKFFRKT